MRKTIGLTAALLILAGSAPLFAADDEQTMTFEGIDTDRDGYISRDEAAANPGLDAHWDQADSNGDGHLTIYEFDDYVGAGRYTPPEDAEVPEPGAAPY